MDPKAQELLNQGILKKRQGHYDEAKALYEAAISLEHAHFGLYYALAKVHFVAHEYDAAVLGYLRAAHLLLHDASVCGAAESPVQPTINVAALPESIIRQASYRHPSARCLLSQPNLCNHLGHALWCAGSYNRKAGATGLAVEYGELSGFVLDDVDPHMEAYAVILAGQASGAIADNNCTILEDNLFIPLAIDWMLDAIQWCHVGMNTDVKNLYPRLGAVRPDQLGFVERNPPDLRMDEFLRGARACVAKPTGLRNIWMAYTKIDPEVFHKQPVNMFAAIGRSCLFGFPDRSFENIEREPFAYLCYLAVPIDDGDNVCENDMYSDWDLQELLEKRFGASVICVGSVCIGDHPRCRTLKFLVTA